MKLDNEEMNYIKEDEKVSARTAITARIWYYHKEIHDEPDGTQKIETFEKNAIQDEAVKDMLSDVNKAYTNKNCISEKDIDTAILEIQHYSDRMLHFLMLAKTPESKRIWTTCYETAQEMLDILNCMKGD